MLSKKNNVWSHYTKDNDKFVCNYCSKQYVKHATRMLEHLIKCGNTPVQIRNSLVHSRFGQNSSNATGNISAANPNFSEELEVDNPIVQSPTKSLQRVYSINEVMNTIEKAKLDKLLGKAIFTSGSPLSLVDNEYWIDIFKNMRPAYKLPSRYQLSNTLLDQEYELVKQQVNVKLTAPYLGLQCNWSNIRHETIINYVVTTPNPVLYKTCAVGVQKHTAQYMATEIIEIIQELGPNKVFGLVTDNASTMRKARQIVVEKYPHINSYGCVAHTLHLLVLDIMKLNSLKAIEIYCKEVIEFINLSDSNLSIFNKLKKDHGIEATLKNPVETKWGSILFSLETMIQVKTIILDLFTDENIKEKLPPHFSTMLSSSFWDNLQDIINILKTPVKWITILEGDGFLLSNVILAFKEIDDTINNYLIIHKLDFISDLEKSEIKNSIKKRKDMAVTKLHYGSSLLDPKICGANLSPDEFQLGLNFIKDFVQNCGLFSSNFDKISGELTQYLAKRGFWENEFIWTSTNHTDSFTWWKGMCMPTLLKDVAMAILGLPASSAATERSFSTYAFLHSARRNRLLADRAGKLTYIAQNSKLLETDSEINIEVDENRYVCEDVDEED